jgi:hypothetical protein
MKTRFGIAAAVVILGFAAPASADTIANFVLDGVTFNDGGTASGSFTLDLTTDTLSNVNITTSTDSALGVGTTFTDSDYSNSFTPGPVYFLFDNNASLPVDELTIELSETLTPSNLASTPSFSFYSDGVVEVGYSSLCPDFDYCGERIIATGSLTDLSATPVSATPLPATLPLFAGGLGFVGYLAKRRKQNAKQALATA